MSTNAVYNLIDHPVEIEHATTATSSLSHVVSSCFTRSEKFLWWQDSPRNRFCILIVRIHARDLMCNFLGMGPTYGLMSYHDWYHMELRRQLWFCQKLFPCFCLLQKKCWSGSKKHSKHICQVSSHRLCSTPPPVASVSVVSCDIIQPRKQSQAIPATSHVTFPKFKVCSNGLLGSQPFPLATTQHLSSAP